ncbi:calcium-responsive transcription factor-like [Engraulis encrasicolus]|uniref:calcium-responsive transcription factor-like n=1 Tax=Engraulis encrasicolus TaxID=184585 RepID=UPI002FD2CD77
MAEKQIVAEEDTGPEGCISVSKQTETMEAPSWVPSFFQIIKRGNDYISGIVQTEEEVKRLIGIHSIATSTSFYRWSDHTSKGRNVWQVEDYDDDTPLGVTKRTILACQHCKVPQKKTKEQQSQGHVQPADKSDCPAKLCIRHVIRYDTFSVKGNATRYQKEDAMKKLKEALLTGSPPTSAFIHLKIPLLEAHNHTIEKGPCVSRKPMHPEVEVKLQEMVAQGMTNISVIKRTLKQFVLNELCRTSLKTPNPSHQRYFPSKETIRFHIRRRMVEGGGERVMDEGEEGTMDGEGERMLNGWGEVVSDSGEEMPDGEGESTLDGGGHEVRSAQTAMRKELKKFMDATYFCDDLETLRNTNMALKRMRLTFEHRLRNEPGNVKKKRFRKKDIKAMPVKKKNKSRPSKKT